MIPYQPESFNEYEVFAREIHQAECVYYVYRYPLKKHRGILHGIACFLAKSVSLSFRLLETQRDRDFWEVTAMRRLQELERSNGKLAAWNGGEKYRDAMLLVDSLSKKNCNLQSQISQLESNNPPKL